jgi:hypothetical protein
MQKTGAEVPEYGTIQQRMAVGIFEFVDPKGRKPVAYTKIMKKLKISEEQVLEEAGKLNINIDANHFVVPESDSKRGRPSTKAEKEPKVKGAKGRPKKEKKVIIDDDEETDNLFDALVAQANEGQEEEEILAKPKKASKSNEEKEAERIAKEQEKAEKEAKRLAEKAEKEAKLAAEKAEKEAKKEAERLAREAKKKAEEDEKAAKKAALEQAKKEKEEKLAAEKAAKTTKTTKKAPEPEEEEEEKLKKIEFEGKKYLKSLKSGVIYDYDAFRKTGDTVVLGKWNDSKNKIEFVEQEESEDEYDD